MAGHASRTGDGRIRNWPSNNGQGRLFRASGPFMLVSFALQAAQSQTMYFQCLDIGTIPNSKSSENYNFFVTQ